MTIDGVCCCNLLTSPTCCTYLYKYKRYFKLSVILVTRHLWHYILWFRLKRRMSYYRLSHYCGDVQWKLTRSIKINSLHVWLICWITCWSFCVYIKISIFVCLCAVSVVCLQMLNTFYIILVYESICHIQNRSTVIWLFAFGKKST